MPLSSLLDLFLRLGFWTGAGFALGMAKGRRRVKKRSREGGVRKGGQRRLDTSSRPALKFVRCRALFPQLRPQYSTVRRGLRLLRRLFHFLRPRLPDNRGDPWE